jgi:hypothetical protein
MSVLTDIMDALIWGLKKSTSLTLVLIPAAAASEFKLVHSATTTTTTTGTATRRNARTFRALDGRGVCVTIHPAAQNAVSGHQRAMSRASSRLGFIS